MRYHAVLAALMLGAVLSVVLSVAGGSAALAAQDGAGCGLGSMAFKGQSGVVPNILAVTTNGTSGSQTFGITSGTSNCKHDAVIMREHEQELFVADNLDALSQELAQGGADGQHVAALSSLLGCPADLQGQVALAAQAGYGTVFASAQAEPRVVLAGLKQQLAGKPALASACTRLT